MKRALLLGVLLLCTMFSAGCVVWSLYPWLSNDTSTKTPSLAGKWVDSTQPVTVIFADNGSIGTYSITHIEGSTNDQNSVTNSYSGALHSLNGHTLLVVGPGPEFDPSGHDHVGAQFTVAPVYLLFNVELTNDIMSLSAVTPEGFEKRAGKCRLALAPRSPDDKDSIPTAIALSRDMEKFVRKNLKDKTFFSQKPLYNLVKQTDRKQAGAATNAPALPGN